MKRFSLFLCLFFTAFFNAVAQSDGEFMEGSVSFITSENVYVRFKSTEKIMIGDTLYKIKSGNQVACLVINQKSSTSCVTTPVNQCVVSKGETMDFKLPLVKQKQKDKEVEKDTLEIKSDTIFKEPNLKTDSLEEEGKPYFKQKIRGRVSVSSYSNLSALPNKDRHRAMGRLSLSAMHINNSKWSFETYMTYRQNFIEDTVPTNYKTKFFNVYNLAIRFDVDSTMSLTLGRKINRKISSVGAIDGLQAEKHFGRFYAGAIVGSRPGIFDYSFNPNLFQFGVYGGVQTRTNKVFSETTVGFLEQRNNSHLDRRYIYVQHASTILKNLRLFGSMELDIYMIENGKPSAKPRLTNFYFSGRYRFSRKISAMVSYDTRKHVIYYETIKTEVEKLLDDDIARQGLRFRLTYKPARFIYGGISYSKRFQVNNLNKSDNINVYIGHSKLPQLGGRLYLGYNFNQSIYLQMNILSVRYSREIVRNKLDGYIYYRFVDYNYRNVEQKTPNQNYVGLNLGYKIAKTIWFSALGEISMREQQNNFRINTKLIKRF
jgi:hypothetical protein